MMAPVEPLTDTEAECVVRALVREDPLVWWENYVEIENKDHQLIRPVANVLQQRIAEYIRYCLKHNIPIRGVVLKPRQKGISTITVGACQWLQKVEPKDALIVGGKDWQVDNLWAIYGRYAATDTFSWGFTGVVTATQAIWGNGSKLGRQTAGGKDPGRSGSFQILIGTEVAYWGHDASVKNASAVLTGLLASIPKTAGTMVFLESTSSGGSGLFYRRWDDAIDLEEFLAGGRSASGMVRIFAGWYEFEDSTLPVESAQEERDIFAGKGARNESEFRREQQLRVKYNLTAGQIKYWRSLLSDCDNDPDKRDREYPTTPEDAFRAAEPCRFNRTMLGQLRIEAMQKKGQLQWGLLEQPHLDEKRYVWRVVQEENESNFCISDLPQVGMRYHISVDNSGGRATGDDKSDTDRHAVTVWRSGYIDANKGIWVRPKIVAVIKNKQKCDVDILEEWVWRLHVFYGHCLVVPEANNDAGLIRGLRKRGCHIYEKERPATDVDATKKTGKFGFWTRGGENENTRKWIIQLLARAVRETGTEGEGLEIPFTWIIDELEHFAVDPDTGREEAMSGWHDDWVLAVAIGLATINGGTLYKLPESSVELPRDIQLLQTSRWVEPGDRV